MPVQKVILWYEKFFPILVWYRLGAYLFTISELDESGTDHLMRIETSLDIGEEGFSGMSKGNLPE